MNDEFYMNDDSDWNPQKWEREEKQFENAERDWLGFAG